VSVLKGEADLVGEAEAHGQSGGLGGLPRENARSFVERYERGRNNVDAGAGGGSVEEDAGQRSVVVGDSGTLVGREVGCGV
jgi:hypothetical protein